MLSSKELQDKIGADSKKLSGWRKEGMPCKKKGSSYFYDFDAVSDWLISKGYAKKETWCDALEAVATILGKNRRSVQTWKSSDTTFPYFQDDGPYCVETIRDWYVNVKSQKKGGREPKAQVLAEAGLEPPRRSRKEELEEMAIEERNESRRISNDIKRKNLVPIKKVKDRLARTTVVISQMLDEQVGLIMQQIPNEVSKAAKGRIEKSVRAQCKVIKRMFSEALRSDVNPEEVIYESDANDA